MISLRLQRYIEEGKPRDYHLLKGSNCFKKKGITKISKFILTKVMFVNKSIKKLIEYNN